MRVKSIICIGFSKKKLLTGFSKKKNCLSEQCEWIKIHSHCWRDAAWCSREKQVGPAFDFHAFQTHNLVGPMNRNLRFFLTKRRWICVLNKTQTQQRRQTRSKKKFPRVFFFFFFECLVFVEIGILNLCLESLLN